MFDLFLFYFLIIITHERNKVLTKKHAVKPRFVLSSAGIIKKRSAHFAPTVVLFYGLYVESEQNHVAVFNDVVLALGTHFSEFFRLDVTAEFE